MSDVRIALLTEIPAPYRIPLFNALAAEPGIELSVFLLRERQPGRDYDLHRDEWQFDAQVLPGTELTVGGRWLVWNRGVAGRLRRERPDVVVLGGWNQPAFWRGLVHGRLHGLPVVTWVESTARDARARSRAAGLARRAALAGTTAFLVPGRASAEYLAAHGVASDRITVAPNSIDTEIFGARVAEARRERDALRARLGVEGCCFLGVGRLAPEKGFDVLLRAFAGIEGELVVAGDGPERSRLRALAPARTRFLGRVPRDELVAWYAAADALVVPSRSEPWGMALSEGAAAGLPLVATEAAGAAWDLVEPGVNGFRVPAGDEAALRRALARTAADPTFRAAAGARSLELAARLTPAAWARAVAGLAHRVAGRGSR